MTLVTMGTHGRETFNNKVSRFNGKRGKSLQTLKVSWNKRINTQSVEISSRNTNTTGAIQMKQIVYLVPHNHFDPTWRRCFNRPAVYGGTTVRSYAEVEAHCIDGLAGAGATGISLQRGADGGVAEISGAVPGEAGGDSAVGAHGATGGAAHRRDGAGLEHAATAEGLVRNFLVAMPGYRELVDADHPALKIASCEDAFGNSPNYPQVLQGVGAEAVLWLFYRPCPEDVWVGIDGTRLPFIDNHPTGYAGNYAKHAPCPECRGARLRELRADGAALSRRLRSGCPARFHRRRAGEPPGGAVGGYPPGHRGSAAGCAGARFRGGVEPRARGVGRCASPLRWMSTGRISLTSTPLSKSAT